jgi:hypothetical protein
MIAVGYLSLVSPALLSFHVSLLTSLAPRVRVGIADVVVGKIGCPQGRGCISFKAREAAAER